MQAILELQRQLKQVQQAANSQAHKLNERNIVDIIQAVLDQNRVKLIYTQDGKEYLTNEQLEKEIKDLLVEYGGRLNTLEIPSYLGVGIDIVERALDQFVKRHKVALFNGQLISNLYTDQVMEELYELVSEQGQVFLQDLTTKYSLPLDYFIESIQKKMDNLPQGCILQNHCLMTRTFADRQNCKVRGILRGVTRPVSLSLMSQQYKIEEQKLKNLTEQLIKDNQIKGKVQSGLFVPASFTQMQENAVKTFYNQNKYIEYQMLLKLQVPKPWEFIDQVIGKNMGQHLTNFYVSNDLISQADAQVQDIVNQGSYIDVSMIVPSPFRNEDIKDFCKIFGNSCRLLDDYQYLCSEKFIQKCIEEFKPRCEELSLQKIKSGFKPQINTGNEESKKQASSKQKQQIQQSKSKGGKKKGGKQQDDDFEETKELNIEDQVDIAIPEEEIQTILLASKISEFKENKDEAEILVQSLADFLLIPVNKLYQQIFLEVFARSSTKSQANQNKNLEADLEEQFQTLQFIQKQIEGIKKTFLNAGKQPNDFDAVVNPVKAHLCKNDCQSLLNKLTMVQAFYNNINLSGIQGLSKDSNSQQPTVLNANDRKLVSKQFQKHVTQIFDVLNKAVSDKNFDEFMIQLSDNIKNLGARMKQIDKKIEKRIKDLIQKNLKDSLKEETIMSPLFDFRHLLTQILNLRLLDSGAYLNLPNEEWAIKIMGNLLIHQGVDVNMDQKKKDDLIKAQNVYLLYQAATKNGNDSEEAQQIKQDTEAHQQLLLEFIK